MRHEDWIHYQRQAETERMRHFGHPPLSFDQKINELRAEVDNLAGRIKNELLAELRVEVERLIEMEMSHANR